MFASRSIDELNRIANTYLGLGISSSSSDVQLSAVHDVNSMENPAGTKLDLKDYSPISLEKSPVVLTWADLTVSTKIKNKAEPKILINHVNGTITGGLWAIMGPSGSGKTTFLGVLSQRLDTSRMTISGTVHLNGKDYTKNTLKAMSGYVMQDDLIHAHLTVGETLMYTALLRMPRTSTTEERASREKQVMEVMGISYCEHVIIGDTRHKGISGGERKRVCVAMELLTDPKLLFLDEPTSGLDSTTALSLCSTLKKMSDSGLCTIVCTIHQPQTMIYELMDNLILMKKGNIMYQGAAAKAVDYFEACGFPCPPRMNPADHLLNVVCLDGSTQGPDARIPKLSPPVDLDFGLDKDNFTARAVPIWISQFYTLFCRNLNEKWRRWDIIVMNLFVTIIVSIFIGTGAWLQIGNHQDGIAKRNAILFFCGIHQGVVSSLQGTYSFPLERALMLRERSAGAYYVSAYFTAKFTADMVYQVPIPIIFSIMVYFLTGLSLQPANKFFIFAAFNILCSMAATSLANMTSCLFVSIEMSTVVLAFFMEITRLYSGFFISPKLLLSTHAYYRFKFADSLSYLKYAYVGMCLNEYTDLNLYCTQTEMAKKLCKITSGNTINETYGYNQYSISFCAGMLVLYICVCRFVSYLALRYIKV